MRHEAKPRKILPVSTFAFLGFGVWVAGVNQGLAAFVAVVPVATSVAVFLAAAIPTNPAHRVLVGCAVGSGLRCPAPPVLGLGLFLGFDFIAGALQ